MWFSHLRRPEPILPQELALIPYSSRSERYPLKLALSFTVNELKQDGISVNVSESGILVAFEKPIEIWAEGEISLLIGEYYVNISARVARLQHNETALTFLVDNENDRSTIRILVDFARTGNLDASIMPIEMDSLG